MRLIIPSVAIGTTFVARSVFLQTLFRSADALRGAETKSGDRIDNNNGGGVYESNPKRNDLEEEISARLKKKLNSKFELRRKMMAARADNLDVSSWWKTEEECGLYPDSFQKKRRTDVGILRCSDPGDVCIRSVQSSEGGFCVASDHSISTTTREWGMIIPTGVT